MQNLRRVLYTLASRAGVLLLVCATAAFAQGTGGTPKGRPFAFLQQQLADLQAQIASLADLQAQIDALETRVDQNTASIDELRQYNQLQDQEIALLGGAVLALEGRMASAEATLEDIQMHDALQDQWLAALETRSRTAEAQLAAHSGDIQALWRATRDLQGWIGGLQLQIEDLQRRIARVEQGVNAAFDDISSLRAELQGVESRMSDLRQQLSTKQNLVQGACSTGSSIRQIYADGTVACEQDDVSAGVGWLQTYTSAASTSAAPGSFNSVYTYCWGVDRLTGGGYYHDFGDQVVVYYNRPVGNYSWFVAIYNPHGSYRYFESWALCGYVSR